MYVKSLVDGRYLHRQGFETWWDDKPTGWAVTFDKDKFEGKRCAFNHQCISLVEA
jgi:hypothetical protein